MSAVKHGRVLPGLLAGMALIFAACGGDSGATGGEEVSGRLEISGSSTVEPITVAVAEKFIAQHPGVDISVSGPGTSDGFELFCNGEANISDASRAIAEEEIAKCEQNGVEFVELKVGIDGLSVITSTENDFIDCLNFADIWALLGPESEGFDTWSDADSLGQKYGASGVPYPDERLVITAPGEESGTFDSFIELTLEVFVKEQGINVAEGSVAPRPDYQASADDNVIIEGVTGTPSSLGWVGYAFYANNQERVKALRIDGGEGCVEPSPEAIASFEYPISRPLFIYVNKGESEQNPDVEEFVDFYLSDEGIASTEEVGYVSLKSSELEATRRAWEALETGTREN